MGVTVGDSGDMYAHGNYAETSHLVQSHSCILRTALLQ